MTHAVKSVLSLIDAVEVFFNLSNDSMEDPWEYKYDQIFKLSAPIRVELDKLGMELEYCDPDTSYEEDVRAYVTALRELRTQIHIPERASKDWQKEECVAKILQVWKEHSELRLGQLILNAVSKNELFNEEDLTLVKKIVEFGKANAGSHSRNNQDDGNG